MSNVRFAPYNLHARPAELTRNTQRVADDNHMHDFLQIFYLHDGECIHNFGDTTVKMTPGTIAIFPAYFPHHADARFADNELFLYGLSDRVFSVKGTYSFSNICLEPLCETIKNKTAVVFPRKEAKEEFARLYLELHKRLNNLFLDKHLPFIGKSVEMLSLIATEYAATQGTLQGSSMSDYCPSVYKAFNYIHANYMNPELTAETVARESMLSVRSFYRIFNEIMGISYHKYIQQLRLIHAKHLLANTDRILADVSHDSGFSNVTGFHRLFRISDSMTPSEYRDFAHNKLCAYPKRNNY